MKKKYSIKYFYGIMGDGFYKVHIGILTNIEHFNVVCKRR